MFPLTLQLSSLREHFFDDPSFFCLYGFLDCTLPSYFFRFLSQLKTDKQQKIQCTESYILFERKVLLEQITLSAQANTPLAFKIQKTL